MNTKLLIDAIVHQTTVLIAQLFARCGMSRDVQGVDTLMSSYSQS